MNEKIDTYYKCNVCGCEYIGNSGILKCRACDSTNLEIKNFSFNEKTLRDEIAISALNGLLSARSERMSMNFNPEDDADYCYKIADAMMKRRSE